MLPAAGDDLWAQGLQGLRVERMGFVMHYLDLIASIIGDISHHGPPSSRYI